MRLLLAGVITPAALAGLVAADPPVGAASAAAAPLLTPVKGLPFATGSSPASVAFSAGGRLPDPGRLFRGHQVLFCISIVG